MSNQTELSRIERQARIRRILKKTFTYLMLTLWAMLVLFPF